jgi:hypothetical protein
MGSLGTEEADEPLDDHPQENHNQGMPMVGQGKRTAAAAAAASAR